MEPCVRFTFYEFSSPDWKDSKSFMISGLELIYDYKSLPVLIIKMEKSNSLLVVSLLNTNYNVC